VLKDNIRNNQYAAWLVTIIVGLVYYYGYSLIHNLFFFVVKWIPADFFVDHYKNEIMWRLYLLNFTEALLVSVCIAFLISEILFYLYDRDAKKYGIGAVFVFLLIYLARIFIKVSSSPDPAAIIVLKIMKLILAAVVFWIVLGLMTKKRERLSSQ
jgi:hypothetical protein